MNLYEVGKNIRALRKEQGLTQEQLSKKADISRVTLGKLERGEVVSVSVRTLILLLDSMGYELEFVNKQGFGLPTLDQLL